MNRGKKDVELVQIQRDVNRMRRKVTFNIKLHHQMECSTCLVSVSSACQEASVAPTALLREPGAKAGSTVWIFLLQGIPCHPQEI